MLIDLFPIKFEEAIEVDQLPDVEAYNNIEFTNDFGIFKTGEKYPYLEIESFRGFGILFAYRIYDEVYTEDKRQKFTLTINETN